MTWLMQGIRFVCCVKTKRHKDQIGKQHKIPWCASALLL